jgi:hypothetical protein
MGRGNYTFRDTNISKNKRLNPIWRGIGFLILVALTVGAFWLAGILLEMHWQQPFPWVPFTIPQNFVVKLHPALPNLSGKLLIQLGAALFIDLVGYALLVVGYSIVNPIRPGKTDAPQPRRRGRDSMVR